MKFFKLLLQLSIGFLMLRGPTPMGGLIGCRANSGVRDSFWDIKTSGISESSGGTGLITDQMMEIQTFLNAGWDFVDETANGTEDIWYILEGQDYPRLWWELIAEN
jgi:hypothetical protein